MQALDYCQPVAPLFELPSRAGTIHSCFRRAVNIAIDDTILALLSSELPRMPNSVRLPPPVLQELLQSLRPGMEVWVGDGRLFIPACDFSLSLPEAPPWNPRPQMTIMNFNDQDRQQSVGAGEVERTGGDACVARSPMSLPPRDGGRRKRPLPSAPPPPPLRMPLPVLFGKNRHHGQRETVAQYAFRLACYLVGLPQWNGLLPLVGPLLLGQPAQSAQPAQETPLARMALPALRMLVRASWRLDIIELEEATRRLAGLGPGLTPAGDDALAGFAAVMSLLSPHLSADTRPRDHLAEIIAAVARSRTTLLSAVLLAFAARGEVAEHLGELLLALARPAEEFAAVLCAADHVLAYGATSGGDTLLGILLGLRALQGEPIEEIAYDHTGAAQA